MKIIEFIKDFDFVAILGVCATIVTFIVKADKFIVTKYKDIDRVGRRNELLALLNTKPVDAERIKQKFREYELRGYNSYMADLLFKNKIISTYDIVGTKEYSAQDFLNKYNTDKKGFYLSDKKM